jgi:hypothetical protein
VAEMLGDRRLRRVEPRAASQAIDRLEAPRRDEPRARVRGHARLRPLLQRCRDGVVQRLLGEVEITEEADERREDAARLGPVDCFDRRRDVVYCPFSSQTGRTSILPTRVPGIFDATWIASLRSRASIM